MKTKKLLLTFVAGMVMVSLFSFKLMYDAKKNTAEVEQMQGLYVYVFSKPVQQYDYLGSEKKSIAWTGKTEEMLNSMIKKVKEDYPQAEGIVFTNAAMDHADAIKFK